jgi:acetolactate synthase I/II/III large subunit
MLGMHGTYEANMAMHDCDVMVCIGARFDDRITGRLDAFSPGSKKIHIDIDPSSINKNVRVDVPIIGDVGYVLEDMLRLAQTQPEAGQGGAEGLVAQIAIGGRAKSSPTAVQRRHHHAAIRDPAALRADQGPRHLHHHRGRPAPDVGGAVLPFEEPNRWMTSGGLGTMGYGLPAALGVQVAHPDALVIDIAGDASVQMTMQEMSTAVQYEAPIKIFILNNQYMGMVRQWQQLLHGNRLSHSYTEALPDFVKLGEAYGASASAAEKPGELDDAIQEMIDVKRPVIFDCRVANARQLLPDDPVGQGAQRDAARRGSTASRRSGWPRRSAPALSMRRWRASCSR